MKTNAIRDSISLSDARLYHPQDKYRWLDAERIELTSQDEFVYSPITHSAAILSKSEITLLEQCIPFATIEEHGHALGRSIHASPGELETLLKRLSELAANGILVSEKQILARITNGECINKSGISISWIGIPTRNRVEGLARCLLSYIDHTTHFHATSFD